MKAIPSLSSGHLDHAVSRWAVGTEAALERYAATLADRDAAGMTKGDIKYPLLQADKAVYDNTDYTCVRTGQKVALFSPRCLKGHQVALISTLDTTLYRHEHDCTSCVFLGQSGEFDMWCCPPNRDDVQYLSGSMIARYGEHGEYASTGLYMIGRALERARAGKKVDYTDAMLMAAARAMRLGIVTPWHLTDSLTELSVSQIRAALEAECYEELPEFLLNF